MNRDELNDLKQFIAVTVSQSEARLRNELASKDDLNRLRDEMSEGFLGVGEAISDINDRLDKRDKEVDARLIRLEQKIA